MWIQCLDSLLLLYYLLNYITYYKQMCFIFNFYQNIKAKMSSKIKSKKNDN